jgi:hypothetical protein
LSAAYHGQGQRADLSPEILACEQADITVTMPKPMTSGAKSDGRLGKQDFVICAHASTS